MGHERASRRRFLASVAGLSTVAVSGCGSDESTTTTGAGRDETDAETITEATTEPSTATAEPTSTPTETPAATPSETSTPTATPDPSSLSDWPSYLYNEQSWGHHPDAVGPHESVSVVWERDLDAAQVNSTPALANGTLYVGDGRRGGEKGTFYALNPLTGETKWTKSFGGPVLGGAAVDTDIVYIGASGSFAAYRPDGTEVWRHDSRSDAAVTAPTIGDGGVYFGLDDGTLYKYDKLTKTQKWYYQAYGAITSPPVFDDGTVYFSSQDNSIYALSKGNDEKWVKGLGETVNGLSIRDGRLYAASENNRLTQINTNSKTGWEQSTGGAAAATPAVNERHVFVGTRDGKLLALSRRDGQEQWRFTGASNGFTAPPVVADGTVYVGSRDNNVYAINAKTGQQEWAFTTDNNLIESAPIVAGGMVFIGSTDGTFYALSD